MKILQAYGDSGNDGKDFNWCNKDEIVGTHGFVCDSVCSCGCNISFSGIHSAKATTRAVVRDVPVSVVTTAITELYETTKKGWGDSVNIAERAVRNFMKLLDKLNAPASEPDGTIVRMSPDGNICLVKET